MADNNVELSVRSRLLQIKTELEQIAEASGQVSKEISGAGKSVSDNIQKQTKDTNRYLNDMRGVAGRIANEIKNDFKNLLNLKALETGFKLSNQFGNTVKETVHLSDTIRKLGSVFGIAKGNFAEFETRITKGLGEIGLSSEAAVESLKGLSQTQVRGEENLTEYAKTASSLAQITGTKGQEGEIAKGMAEVTTARGGNVNDAGQMKELGEQLLKIFNSTGMNPKQAIESMKDIFAKMPQDLRKSLSVKSISSLATISATAGPNSTKFLEEYLGKSPIARKAMEARGFGNMFGKEGFNTEKFGKSSKNLLGQFQGDPRLMAQTLGLSEEAAEGFVRLTESLDKVKAAQDKQKNSQATINQQLRESSTLGEAFAASLNKVKAGFAPILSKATQGATNTLQKASESTGGAMAVTGGAAIFSALLAGGALKGLAKMIPGGNKAGGIAEAAAYEKITGKEVQSVYVVNANEIGAAAGGTGAGAAGGVGAAAEGTSKVGKVIKGFGAAAGGAAIGYGLGEGINKYGPQQELARGGQGGLLDVAADKISDFGRQITGKDTFSDLDEKQKQIDKTNSELSKKNTGMNTGGEGSSPQRVIVILENKSKDIKASAMPAKGAVH